MVEFDQGSAESHKNSTYQHAPDSATSMNKFLKNFHSTGKVVLCVCIIALIGCTTSYKKYYHGLAFGPYNDGVEILDFQYGDEPNSLTNASTYGHDGGAPQKIIVWLNMPKSNLRVKWRDLATKKEYEQIADKGMLPSDVEGKQVWFEIKENLLQVYIVDSSKKHRPSMPDCGAYMYRYYECEQVFPRHAANF